MKKTTGANSTFAIGGVLCTYESEVLHPGSVLLRNFNAKNPHPSLAAARWASV